MEKNIDKIKKAKEVQEDILKLNKIINTRSLLLTEGNDIVNKLNSKLEYLPYISILKVKYGIGGKVPFEKLTFDNKIKALQVLREALYAFVEKELGEELYSLIKENKTLKNYEEATYE